LVWLVEKKIFYHSLDIGFERVKIPLRVKFEFEVRQGSLVSDSLSYETLFNKQVLAKRYPQARMASVEKDLEKTVRRNIFGYLNDCGYLRVDGPADFSE